MSSWTRARTRVAELAAAEGDAAGREVHQEAGTDRLADLVNKDPVFEVCFTDPRLLACLAHVLGDFKLSSLNSRAALSRRGPAGAARGGRAGRPRPVPGVQLDLAARRLHRGERGDPGGAGLAPPDRVGSATQLPDPLGPHPDQVTLTAPAGTVIVFNSHLWHGGTRNNTDRPRRALHSYFTGRANGQQLNQREYIRPETLARLSPAAAFILDV